MQPFIIERGYMNDLDIISLPRSRKSTPQAFRRPSWGESSPDALGHSLSETINTDMTTYKDINHENGCGDSISTDDGEPWNKVDNLTALGLSFHTDEVSSNREKPARFTLDSPEPDQRKVIRATKKPFNKWLKSLHRRAIIKSGAPCEDLGDSVHSEGHGVSRSLNYPHHKQSSSGSSFGFVTAVKSASISLASFSMAPRSRRTAVSSRHFRTDRSSKASNLGVRYSEESTYTNIGDIIDAAVTDRSLQRRHVLEELISTEEDYVADIRFLMNVGATICVAKIIHS
jgi:hypothetical protein